MRTLHNESYSATKRGKDGKHRTAIGMFNAGDVLYEYFQHHDIGTVDEKARKRSTLIPLVVLYFFGIEVGMKALIEKQEQKPHCTHDLQGLYKNLTDVIRTRIDERLASRSTSLPKAEKLLAHHRDSFKNWRYMGDSGGIQTVDPIAVAETLRAIIEVHTEAYGSGKQEEPDPKGEGGVPSTIHSAARKYMKDVL